ncbi:beta-1,3-galactosyltransferase 2-like [Pleurodeles waltl]|uniref:beta-1,3-galactosyltransferase 2-like n=1 Tax=Pleurodeles waltl TaxID=8319 RepID=UPI00370984ED
MLRWMRRLWSITVNYWMTKSLPHHCLTGLLLLICLLAPILLFIYYGHIPDRAVSTKKQTVYGVEEFQSGKTETNLLGTSLKIAHRILSHLKDTVLVNVFMIPPSKDHRHKNEPHFKYIVNEPDKCKESRPFVVLMVPCSPAYTEARQAIRKTWGNETLVPGTRILRIFLLGIPAQSESKLQQAIIEESRHYNDIVQQEYLDSYINLTIKTIMGMHWVATYCPHTSYVMKADCDVFVNTEYLVHHLLKPDMPPRQDYFTGYLMRGYVPNRNNESKWYMPLELYPGNLYPVFCSGTGYVLSGDLAKKIFDISLNIRQLPLEDVYVGVCLSALGIAPVAPPKESDFNHWRVSFSTCQYSHLVTSHGFQPHELIQYWNLLQKHKHHAC